LGMECICNIRKIRRERMEFGSKLRVITSSI